MFDRLRLFFAKGAQGVCGGVEERVLSRALLLRRSTGLLRLIGGKAHVIADIGSVVIPTAETVSSVGVGAVARLGCSVCLSMAQSWMFPGPYNRVGRDL